MNKLRVVLDTNVFLVVLAKNYKYHWIFEALVEGKFELCVSTDILMEYQEQISKRYGVSKTDATLDFLILLPSVILVEPYYNWKLIAKDGDDDKFVDCSVAGKADLIVTNDKHFKVLDSISFPPINRMRVEEFEIKYKSTFQV